MFFSGEQFKSLCSESNVMHSCADLLYFVFNLYLFFPPLCLLWDCSMIETQLLDSKHRERSLYLMQRESGLVSRGPLFLSKLSIVTLIYY